MCDFFSEQIKADGCFVLKPGVNEDLDDLDEKINSAKAELQTYLEEQRRELKDKSIVFYDRNKERYQLEMSTKTASKLSDEYELMSSTKGTSPM